jgi:hypothetical protein
MALPLTLLMLLLLARSAERETSTSSIDRIVYDMMGESSFEQILEPPKRYIILEAFGIKCDPTAEGFSVCKGDVLRPLWPLDQATDDHKEIFFIWRAK